MPDWFERNGLISGASAQPSPASPSTPASAAGDWFDQNGLTAAAPQQPSEPAQSRSWMDEAGDYLKGVWNTVNPIEGVKSLATAVQDPIGAGKAMLTAQDEVRLKAEESFKKGDYVGGMRHAIGYLLPIVGPAIDSAGDKAEQGKVAEGLGEATGLGLTTGIPGVAKRTPSIRVTPKLKPSLNRAGAEAVAFADREGIPLTAADRSGSRFMRNVQGWVGNEIGGSGTATRAVGERTKKLGEVGNRLADQVHPGPVTAEQAGAGLRGTLEADLTQTRQSLASQVHAAPTTPEAAGAGLVKKFQTDIQTLHKQADQAYSKLHKIERDPANIFEVPVNVAPASQKPVMARMALPVDMRPIKDALKDLAAKYQYTTPQAKSRASVGLKALENILEGSDFKPASAAELDLGMLKEAARSEMPELRDISQGLAANGVKELQTAIDAAVSRARVPGGSAPGTVNPALQALRDGRKLTAQKWETDDLLKTFGNDVTAIEPVQVFQRLTWGKDSGIETLRQIAKAAPQEMPKFGRAFIDAGGNWDALGTETKNILFGGNKKLIADLDAHHAASKRFGPLLSKEPVAVFDHLTRAEDGAIGLLRDVQKRAPAEVPKIGRAYLEGLLETATKEGDFRQARTVLSQWEKLGDSTKRALFKNPVLIKDLDNFFQLAKNTMTEANPSGTAYVTSARQHVVGLVTNLGLLVSGVSSGGLGLQGAYVITTAGLSGFLHNPKASRALMTGLRVPLGTQAAAAAAAAQILKLAGDEAKPLEQHEQ